MLRVGSRRQEAAAVTPHGSTRTYRRHSTRTAVTPKEACALSRHKFSECWSDCWPVTRLCLCVDVRRVRRADTCVSLLRHMRVTADAPCRRQASTQRQSRRISTPQPDTRKRQEMITAWLILLGKTMICRLKKKSLNFTGFWSRGEY